MFGMREFSEKEGQNVREEEKQFCLLFELFAGDDMVRPLRVDEWLQV